MCPHESAVRRRGASCAAVICLTALALAQCERGDKTGQAREVSYGEAVAIRVEGAHLAPYEIRVSASEGSRVEPLVQPLTALVHPALLACPGVIPPAPAAEESITISFSLESGRLKHGRRVDGDDPPAMACLLEHLDDRLLASADPLPEGLLLQLRFAPGAGPREGTDARP